MNNKFGKKSQRLTLAEKRDEHRYKSLDGMASKLLKQAGFSDTLRRKKQR